MHGQAGQPGARSRVGIAPEVQQWELRPAHVELRVLPDGQRRYLRHRVAAAAARRRRRAVPKGARAERLFFTDRYLPVSRILATAWLSAAGLLWAPASHAQQPPTRIYYFVDEQGVPHFSNVPTDSRYRVFSGSENLAAQTPPGSAPAHAPTPVAATDTEPTQPPEDEYGSSDR